MRFNLLSCGAGLVSLATLCGCSADDLASTVSADEQYVREFVKTFGVTDPDHDWTAAARSSVTVVTSSASRVKVIATYAGTQYLFADFKDVEGSRTLEFDLPKGAENLILRVNGRDYSTAAGATVNVAATASRAITEGQYFTSKGNITINKAPESQWRNISTYDVGGYNAVMPEGKNNSANTGVTLDFAFRSVGPIVIYPVYWNTSQNNELGIAYYENGELQHIPIWSIYRSTDFDDDKNIIGVMEYEYLEKWESNYFYKEEAVQSVIGDRAVYGMDPNDVTPREYLKIIEATGVTNIKTVVTVNGGMANGSGTYATGWGDGGNYVMVQYITDSTPLKEGIRGLGTGNGADIGSSATHAVHTRGMYVDIPVGMSYFMYIKRSSDGTVLYSNSDYNPSGAHHAATWVGPKLGWTWLSFEDWLMDEGSDQDINDMVFIIDNLNMDPYTPPVDVIDPDNTDDDDSDDPQPFAWIVACEDLGGTYDHDFNDVVFGVQHLAGSRDVYVTALAAGGTLPVELYFNGLKLTGGSDPTGWQYTVYSPTGAMEFGEWHEWFGAGSSQVVNANGFTVGATVRIRLNDDEEFTMSGDADNITVVDGRLGGFHVQVTQTDGVTTTITAPVKSENPGTNIPQMFVTTLNFEWPVESMPVYQSHQGEKSTGIVLGVTPLGIDFYPNSFHAWAQDAEANSAFHHTRPTGRVVNHGWTGYDITE